MKYRAHVFNIVGFALMGLAYQQGLIQLVLDGDRTHLSLVIFGAFLLGLYATAFNHPLLARFIERRLTILGLIGTVVGFIIALGSINPAAAGDIDQIAGMVSGLIGGLGVAMYTTLVGAVGSLWLSAVRFLSHPHA